MQKHDASAKTKPYILLRGCRTTNLIAGPAFKQIPSWINGLVLHAVLSIALTWQ
jgi:hypothetical protein